MGRLAQFLGYVALISGTTWGLVRWLTRKAKAEYELLAGDLKRVNAIPTQEAIRRADSLLGREELFHCVVDSESPATLHEDLPPLLRSFLSRYREVATTSGQLTIVSRDSVHLSATKEGFISIGRGMEATDVEYEIAIRPGREEIFDLYPDEEVDPAFGSYSTIYHWIVALGTQVEEGARMSDVRRR